MDSSLPLKDAIEAVFGPGAFELIEQGDLPDETDCDPAGPDGALPEEPTPFADSRGHSRHAGDALGQLEPQSCALAQSSDWSESLLLFEMSRAWFAVPIRDVVEVQRLPRVTRLPRAAEWLRGVANLRGQIVSVIDLHWFLDSAPQKEPGEEFLMIVRSLKDQTTVGLVVDKVLGIRGIEPHGDGESHPPVLLKTGFIRQITTCDGRNVAVVDVERLLSSTQ
jgi:chemotaxis signal transduction protein